MNFWPKSQKTSGPAEDTPEELAPRSTLLPPPPPGMGTPRTPRTMRVPVTEAPALAMVDAAEVREIDVAYEDFGFEKEESPKGGQAVPCRPTTPTLPCRFA